MAANIVVIQGHPDSNRPHFCHALATAYANGARAAGHSVQTIDVGALNFDLLRTAEAFNQQASGEIAMAQTAIANASHLLIIYPLWLGSMPALLKGFLEQVFRPGFAFDPAPAGKLWKKRLKGKSCRIVITMGMPALVYRWFFGAHSLKSLERNILGFCGIGPIRETLIGMVEGDAGKRAAWLQKMEQLGHRGE